MAAASLVWSRWVLINARRRHSFVPARSRHQIQFRPRADRRSYPQRQYDAPFVASWREFPQRHSWGSDPRGDGPDSVEFPPHEAHESRLWRRLCACCGDALGIARNELRRPLARWHPGVQCSPSSWCGSAEAVALKWRSVNPGARRAFHAREEQHRGHDNKPPLSFTHARKLNGLAWLSYFCWEKPPGLPLSLVDFY